MADFSGDIQNFERYGTYTYKFDAVGNLTFDSGSSDFSRVYLAFPLRNVVYNNAKIEATYDPTFTEFLPSPLTLVQENSEEIQQQIDLLETENASLKSQLNSLTDQSNSDSSVADKVATKQVILELRKALGQGRVDSDFSEDFPYSPIAKKASIVSDTENQSSQPVIQTQTTSNQSSVGNTTSAPNDSGGSTTGGGTTGGGTTGGGTPSDSVDDVSDRQKTIFNSYIGNRVIRRQQPR